MLIGDRGLTVILDLKKAKERWGDDLFSKMLAGQEDLSSISSIQVTKQCVPVTTPLGR